MSPRFARFLTRLYPPAWRARYGEEFQTFLESRHLSAREILNVTGRAAVEHVSEDWPFAPILIAFTFAAGGSVYFATGHPFAPSIEAHFVLGLAWIGLEAGSLAVAVWAVSAVARVLYRGIGGHILNLILRIILPACAVVALQILPWSFPSVPMAALTAVLAAIAGFAFLQAIRAYARYVLTRLKFWGPRRLELLRVATSILSISVFSAQFGMAAYTGSRMVGEVAYWVALGTILNVSRSMVRQSPGESKAS